MNQTLVIGSAVVDVIVRVEHLPKCGEDVHVSSQSRSLGGCAYLVSDILRHFGARVEIEHENALAQTRAFVQLIRCQETKEPWEETNFGAADLRRWLYIGPKERPLQAGDKVRAGGAAYVAQHAAAIYVGAEKSHWWGILRLEREGLV